MDFKTLAAASLLFVAVGVTSASAQITVEIVNDSGVAPASVYVLLTGNSASASGITPNAASSVPLSSLPAGSDPNSYQFTLNTISSGRIFFSFDGALASSPAPSPLTEQTRFDQIELTYPGVANLTSVDFYGIPLQIETLDGSGNVLQTLTLYASTETLVNDLLGIATDVKNAIVTTDGNPLDNNWSNFARILSPTQTTTPGFTLPAYPSQQPYVNSAASHNTTLTISGVYTGSIGPNPNPYNYTGSLVPDSGGNLTFTGTTQATPAGPTSPAYPANSPVVIPASSLAQAIYSNNGPFTVNGSAAEVSDNTVYSNIYRDIVAGFDFGFVDGKYGNNSSVWYSTVPYHPPFAAARSNPSDGFYNQYASVIYQHSDAYGFPFSDRIQPVQAGLSGVAKLRVTILPDNLLDAPVIKTVNPSNNSIAVKWEAVTGATGYTITVTPPLTETVINAGNVTSYTIPNLSPGTPYTIKVAATNSTQTSNALPFTVSTTGNVQPVTGSANWTLTAFFPAVTESGQTATFNGATQTIPVGSNPAFPFTNIGGVPGAENFYVFEWKDASGAVLFSSIFYAAINAGSPTTINMAPSGTFMTSNQSLPTGSGNSLFLNISPTVPRTVVMTAPPAPAPPKPAPEDDSADEAKVAAITREIDFARSALDRVRGSALPATASIRRWLPVRLRVLNARLVYPDDEVLDGIHRQVLKARRSMTPALRRSILARLNARLSELRGGE